MTKNQIMGDVTVGVEIEIEGFSRDAVSLPPNLRYEIHDDGSIRQQTYHVEGLDLAFHHRDRRGRVILPSGISSHASGSIGLEVVTSPYKYSDAVPLFREVAESLATFPRTPLSSIHIHVSCAGVSWRKIQRLLEWVYWLEAPLYRIAAAGRSHRGSEIVRSRSSDYQRQPNNYRFCRPLSAPMGVLSRDSYRPLIDMFRILNASSASEMLAHWGRLDMMWPREIGRWIPHRLHMVNIIPLARQGTFEWRLFDSVYSLLPVFLDVVVALHRVAFHEPEKIPSEFVCAVVGSSAPLVLGTKLDPEQSSRVLDSLSDLLDVDLSSAWGKFWSQPVSSYAPRSHYSEYSITPLSLSSPSRIVVNNRGQEDPGNDSFVLFV